MDLLDTLKPNDIAAIIFGFVGMIFGLASYKRAKKSEALSVESNERAARAEARATRNEEQTLELAFAQRKAEALALITQGETALMAARRKMWSLRTAAQEAGAPDVLIEQAEGFAKSYEFSLSNLGGWRKELEATTSAGSSHQTLVTMMERHIASMQHLTDPKKIDEETALFTDEAERMIRLLTVRNGDHCVVGTKSVAVK